MNFKPVTIFFVASMLLTSPAFAKPASSKLKGTYSFKSSSGKPYIGKSIDIQRRLKAHERSGKLKSIDKSTVKVEKYGLSDKGIRVIEKTKIRSADVYTNGGLQNKQNAPFSRKNKK